jgi:sulfite reductase alpha subunit-like flavoprotein
MFLEWGFLNIFSTLCTCTNICSIAQWILGYNSAILETTVRWFCCIYQMSSMLHILLGLIFFVVVLLRLVKSLPADLFQGIDFAIFCLGDRCYGPDKFCAAGRKLMIRLRQLGAELYVPPGYGDDGTPGGGVFTDLDHWLQTTLLPKLPSDYRGTGVKSSINGNDLAPSPPPYRLKVLSNTDTNTKAVVVGVAEDVLEECQMPFYLESYQSFFQMQCPSSAYQYSIGQNASIQRFYHPRGNFPSQSPPLLGRVVENRLLTAANWEQSTRHICLAVNAKDNANIVKNSLPDDTPELQEQFLSSWNLDLLPYRAGDVAAILPSNSSHEVNAFINVLPMAIQQIVDHVLSIEAMDVSSTRFAGIGYRHWPRNCTLRGWLTYCADIHALPEREDLRALAPYCSIISPTGISQAEKLVALSESEHSALYVDYILREKRSWVDVLYDFDSLRDAGSQLTVEVLLGLLAPIRPRLFSIASSPTRDWIGRNSLTSCETSPPIRHNVAFSIELCVAVVEGTTRLKRGYHGLCSHYLGCLSSGRPSSIVRLWVQPGSFHGLPLSGPAGSSKEDKNCLPLLCIGAGTGIAPLRALIQEREAVLSLHLCSTLSAKADVSVEAQQSVESKQTLIFGCRKKDSDFYYKDEWATLVESGHMMLFTAFSQDQWHKVYVQQVLASEFGRENIARLIMEYGGAVYIAGGPKMARSVIDVIVESLSQHLQCEERESRKLLTKIQNQGLFSVEAWS